MERERSLYGRWLEEVLRYAEWPLLLLSLLPAGQPSFTSVLTGSDEKQERIKSEKLRGRRVYQPNTTSGIPVQFHLTFSRSELAHMIFIAHAPLEFSPCTNLQLYLDHSHVAMN